MLDFDERPDLARPNGVWNLGSAEAAELTKLAETTYRDVNIALANEFARFAESAGLDVYQVIQAANSQPFSHIHRPGISVGGHCIPVYPRSTWPAIRTHSFRLLPGGSMRLSLAKWCGLLAALTGGLAGLRVAVLGAAYRAGVKETAFSGVFAAVAELSGHAALPLVQDPLYSHAELRGLGFEPYRFGQPCDAAIIHTDHAEYASLEPTSLPGIRGLVDGRAITDPARWTAVPYRVLGIGSATEDGRAGSHARMPAWASLRS